MTVKKILVGIILLVPVCSFSARAQSCPYERAAAAAAAAGSKSSASTHSGSIIVSGSEGTFVPSSFQKFDKAVAVGSTAPGASHSTFMTYDQAVQKGIAENAAKAKSPAEAAREYQKKKQQRPQTAKSAQDAVRRILQQ